jgi:two-component system, OmpR family, sensor kinase
MLALLVAALGGVWYALAAALLPEPPDGREIALGAVGALLVLLVMTGPVAIVEASATRRAEARTQRFLTDASHELRTPIAGVLATAETLLRAGPGGADQQELLVQILREAHRAARLVDDLLTLTRLERQVGLATEPVDLVPLATAAVELTRELAPSLDVQLHAPGRAETRGDPARIRQVLDNLLSNARNATPAGGQITVRITSPPGEIRVEVTDTGPGVPAADRDRIFDRFTRLAGPPGGSGPGLAISRSIAEAHSGTLSCAEPDGAGARFVLRLPRSA